MRLDRLAYSVATRAPTLQRWAGQSSHARRLARRLGLLRSGVHPIAEGPARGMLIDVEGSRPSYVLGTTEPLLQRFLSDHLTPGATMYDLGANVGFFTLIGAALVGPTGRVVAVEPSPANVAALERNVALNGLRHVIVREAAVSDETGRAFFDPSDNDQSGRLADTGEPVLTTTVDDLVRGDGYVPDLIKIDVEGAEDRVIAGMASTLTHHPVIVCEMHTGRTSLEDDVPVALAAAGYELSWLEGQEVAAKESYWAPHLVAVPGD